MDITQYAPVIAEVLAKLRIPRTQREDMTQECYVALLEELNESDDRDRVVDICRRRIWNINDKQTRMVPTISADVPNVSHHLSKIGFSEEGNTSESELNEAIQTLPEEDREVIQLRFIEGLTQKQTCSKLGLTLKAARWRQDRGVAALKKYFEVEDARD